MNKLDIPNEGFFCTENGKDEFNIGADSSISVSATNIGPKTERGQAMRQNDARLGQKARSIAVR